MAEENPPTEEPETGDAPGTSEPEQPQEPAPEPAPDQPEPEQPTEPDQGEQSGEGEQQQAPDALEQMTRSGRARAAGGKTARRKAEAKKDGKATGSKKAATPERMPSKKELREEREAATAKIKADKEAAKPRRVDDPDLITAHKATALATGGSVDNDGHLTVGETKFGAAVNTTQIKVIRDALGSRNVLQFLGGVSENQLREYARGDRKSKDLPEDTRKALRELNKGFDPKLKMWARKDAAILATIHSERKAASRKRGGGGRKQAAPAAREREPVAA